MTDFTKDDNSGHSANVQMYLTVDGQTIKIGQMGPDFIIMDGAPELPACEGKITMSIDGNVTQIRVSFPCGISASRIKTKVARL